MQTPPQNLNAEAGLLGTILFNNPTFYRVQDLVRSEDFYELSHQLLFAAMSKRILAGETADGITLQDEFKTEWLADLHDHAVSGMEADDYAKVIADCALRRSLVMAAGKLQANALKGDGAGALDALEGELEGLRGNASQAIAIECASDNLEDLIVTEEAKALLRTGIGALDNGFGGLERGALSVIAARPGVGKTAVSICIAANIAHRETVGFISLDMQKNVIKQRLACYLNWQRGKFTPYTSALKTPGMVSQEMSDDLHEAMKAGPAGQFFLTDRGGVTTADINAQIRAWKRHCSRRGLPPLGAVFVDHIAKVTPRQPYRGLYEKTSFACNELLEVSKQHKDVAIVALCQLNREGAKTARRPMLSDLRDSGKIEEDASAVLLLHREDLDWELIAENKGVSQDEREHAKREYMRCKGQFEVIIGKNRNDRQRAIMLRHSIGQNIISDPRQREQEAVA